MTSEQWQKAEIALAATFILVISLALIAPQYKITTTTAYQSGGTPGTSEEFFYFDHSKTISRTDVEFSSYHNSPEIGDALALEKLAITSSLILAWMFLIILIFGQDLLKVVIGWMATVIAVITAAYPIASIPDAIRGIDGFFGSSNEGLVTTSWSPSSGWYLTVIAAVMIAFVAFRRMSSYFKEPREKIEEDASLHDETSEEELTR